MLFPSIKTIFSLILHPFSTIFPSGRHAGRLSLHFPRVNLQPLPLFFGQERRYRFIYPLMILIQLFFLFLRHQLRGCGHLWYDAAYLRDEAGKEQDQDKRIELYAQAAELVKTAPTSIMTLYCQEKAYAYRDTIENYAAGTFNNFYRIHEWKMAE